MSNPWAIDDETKEVIGDSKSVLEYEQKVLAEVITKAIDNFFEKVPSDEGQVFIMTLACELIAGFVGQFKPENRQEYLDSILQRIDNVMAVQDGNRECPCPKCSALRKLN
jgi:hypothetical protein